jgi:hypothetical protein
MNLHIRACLKTITSSRLTLLFLPTLIVGVRLRLKNIQNYLKRRLLSQKLSQYHSSTLLECSCFHFRQKIFKKILHTNAHMNIMIIIA